MRAPHTPFNVGDYVFDKTDGRHVGRIVLIDSNIWARIQWLKDWKPRQLYSIVRLSDLQIYDGTY